MVIARLPYGNKAKTSLLSAKMGTLQRETLIDTPLKHSLDLLWTVCTVSTLMKESTQPN